MKHRHKWRAGSYGGDTVEYRCQAKDCKATYKRKDRKMVRRKHAAMMRDSDRIHRVWHAFVKHMKLGTVQQSDYALMEKARRWSEKHPKDVVVTGCDDGHHSSSELVIVAHRNGRKSWMGLTVVGLMQNDGQEPFEFFLYPNHVKRLIEALKHFERLRKTCQRRGL
jgi:hypothetical protein